MGQVANFKHFRVQITRLLPVVARVTFSWYAEARRALTDGGRAACTPALVERIMPRSLRRWSTTGTMRRCRFVQLAVTGFYAFRGPASRPSGFDFHPWPTVTCLIQRHGPCI